MIEVAKKQNDSGQAYTIFRMSQDTFQKNQDHIETFIKLIDPAKLAKHKGSIVRESEDGNYVEFHVEHK